MSGGGSTRPGASVPTVTCPRCGAPNDHLRACPACGRPADDPRLDTLIAGKYRIEELIGEGGMGTVYRARWEQLETEVAVKFLRKMWTAGPEIRERFRREAVALARLKHPGIVALLDHGEVDDVPFTVMELVAGRPLSEVVADGPLSLPHAVAVFDQILEVLEVTHAARIVHRDMKLDNVMLVPVPGGTDRVKVLDFGLAHLDDVRSELRLTETGTTRGTAHYMSPEQCRGIDVGTPTDVYAVGVMLFEALTGAPPFQGEDAPTLMAQQLFMTPPPLSERGSRPDVGPGVEAVVRAALAKRADARPTAAEMRVALLAAARRQDPASRALTRHEARSRDATLRRDDRALDTPSAPTLSSAEERATRHVLVWTRDAARAEALRTALAVHGIPVVERSGEAEGAFADDVALGAVLATPRDESGVRALRGEPRFARVPWLAMDVPTETAVVGLVRAGASDVVFQDQSDVQIVEKVRRLLRRGR